MFDTQKKLQYLVALFGGNTAYLSMLPDPFMKSFVRVLVLRGSRAREELQQLQAVVQDRYAVSKP
jgi:hypothetical protein